ncbi:tRNA synthetases class I (M)-domain-containing protein [Phakopsora pachyrhizi]|nr:tRNA synthetases class I (M)-domain-containing protein [Phakopsora pachyrhizi]
MVLVGLDPHQQKIREGVELTPQITNSEGKVIPHPDRRNILITSALPYVNNAPHLGNIIGSVLSADVFARYCRTGPEPSQVLFISGTDEYGTTTETKALEEGLSPMDLCNKYHKVHKDSYDWFDIAFDYFGRTTNTKQTEICQEIFEALYNNGHLNEHEMEQVYCEKDSRFLADRFVEGTCPKCGAGGARGDQCDTCCQTLDAIDLIDKKCKICASSPISKKSKHLFLDLPKLQPKIESWYMEAKKGKHWSSNGQAFTEAWLRDGLRERCLTRDLKWGVPVPMEGWRNKVMYVWFDAPIGYLSITANYTDEWKKWWKSPKDVALYQFMGKDNVPFHTILFPASLMGSGQEWTMLNHISTTEYLQYENVKFSKSNNVGVFGQNARETGVPSEVWRYFLISSRPETNDAQFTWNDFISKANSELLNNLGNFVNRVVKFCNARFQSTVPNPLSWPITGPPSSPGFPESTVNETARDQFDPEDSEFVHDINKMLSQYIESAESIKLRNALSLVMAISARGNQYLQDNKIDYNLLLAHPRRCAQIVLVSLNLVYLLSVLVHPYMPTTEELILKQLNAPHRRLSQTFGIDLMPGHMIGEAIYLFRKIDTDRASFWRKQYGGNKPTASANQSVGGSRSESKKNRKKSAHSAQAMSATAPKISVPKSEEMIQLEAQINLQGNLVRQIKGGAISGDTKTEVGKLLDLKKQMTQLTESLSSQ